MMLKYRDELFALPVEFWVYKRITEIFDAAIKEEKELLIEDIKTYMEGKK